MVSINISLPREIYVKLEEICRRLDMKPSTLIKIAIEEWVRSYGKEGGEKKVGGSRVKVLG
ncbi:MAG: hypothetical protein QXX41_08330 [Nitrososphaerota archaeon]